MALLRRSRVWLLSDALLILLSASAGTSGRRQLARQLAYLGYRLRTMLIVRHPIHAHRLPSVLTDIVSSGAIALIKPAYKRWRCYRLLEPG